MPELNFLPSPDLHVLQNKHFVGVLQEDANVSRLLQLQTLVIFKTIFTRFRDVSHSHTSYNVFIYLPLRLHLLNKSEIGDFQLFQWDEAWG